MSALSEETVDHTPQAGVLTFLAPPPGLAPLDRFALAPIDGTGQLFTLRAVDAPDTRLFLLDPEPFFPDYHPAVDPETLDRLGVDDGEVTVLVVVRPSTDGGPHTANLLAPVLINASSGIAEQVVLDGDSWPLRAPLTAA